MRNFRIPKFVSGFAYDLPKTDPYLGIDKIGRFVLSRQQHGFLELPQINWQEFSVFFSARNYSYLQNVIASRTNNVVPQGLDLINGMVYAWSAVQPRSEELDPLADQVGPAVTYEYVRRMNKIVVDIAANTINRGRLRADTWERMKTLNFGPLEGVSIPRAQRNLAANVDFSAITSYGV